MKTNDDTHPQGTQIDRATPPEDPDGCDFTPALVIAMLELGSQVDRRRPTPSVSVGTGSTSVVVFPGRMDAGEMW